MKWEEGRQGGKYSKLKVWSKWFFDCWIIKYKPHYSMPIHTDKVKGKNHFRLNIVLKGSGAFNCEKTIFNILDTVILFRSDLHEHSMINGSKERLVASFGVVI